MHAALTVGGHEGIVHTSRQIGELDAQRRTGALFLDKYNAPDARASYEAVLQRAPTDAQALLGLARVEEFVTSTVFAGISGASFW